jgi:hypothetical protein
VFEERSTLLLRHKHKEKKNEKNRAKKERKLK